MKLIIEAERKRRKNVRSECVRGRASWRVRAMHNPYNSYHSAANGPHSSPLSCQLVPYFFNLYGRHRVHGVRPVRITATCREPVGQGALLWGPPTQSTWLLASATCRTDPRTFYLSLYLSDDNTSLFQARLRIYVLCKDEIAPPIYVVWSLVHMTKIMQLKAKCKLYVMDYYYYYFLVISILMLFYVQIVCFSFFFYC